MPEIDVFTKYYLEAFFALSSSRNVGMGLSAIPLSEILVYCSFLGDDDPQMFVEIMQRVDGIYLSLANKAQKDD